MALPVHRRAFDAFLSHAHQDREFVDGLYRWLGEVAGFEIWYDAKKLPAGTPIATGLQRGIEQSRGILLVASPEAVSRGWVQHEVNVALDEHAQSSDFRVIALRMADANVAELVRGISWIDLNGSAFTGETGAAIIRAFHPGDRRPDVRNSRDLYVSATWHRDEGASARAVCRHLDRCGFRLIGDATDQRGFRGDRIESIAHSCGGLVAVIPFRGDEPASQTEGPYRYFLREIEIARKANLPVVVAADPRVRAHDGSHEEWLDMKTAEIDCPSHVTSALEDLWGLWRTPPRPHFVFLATDLDASIAARNSDVREIIERVTGMETLVGNEIREAPLQASILRALQEAFLTVADISGPDDRSFNIEVCIEAGMARASGGAVELLVRGEARRPPFMLRDMQVYPYRTDVELLGRIYRIVLGYRRRIINAELREQFA